MSFEHGYFLASHKHAIVRPRIKKPSLDVLDIKSFRPISNISFLSKLTERLVVNRFNKHTDIYHLLPVRQSAYRQFHSTETAIAIVHYDIVCTIDAGNVSVLVLLDLSTAFDTVDHGVLLDVLRHQFGVADVALNWFSSYLSDRTQSFSVISGISRPVNLKIGRAHV